MGLISRLSPIEFNILTKESKKYKNDATPQQITKISIDKTEALEEILRNMNNNYNSYLGELNYAFVSFLLGQCFEGLDQWRQMTEILLECENGLETHKELFIKFINLIYNQVFTNFSNINVCDL